MAVLKEYLCHGHGKFETADEPPVCPRGCTSVERRFYTANGYIGSKSKNIDATYQQIANDFGLSDMNTHGGTTAARVLTKQQKDAQALEAKLRHRFAELPKGGTYNVGTRRQEGGAVNGGAIAGMSAHGATPVEGVSAARNEFVKPVHSVTDFRHQVVIKRDPDKESGLKVKSA